MQNITYISAGAGSGKTTRIIDELVNAIKDGKHRPSEIMMTTFTRAAAQEMQERAKKKLLELDMPDKANEMGAATIGTIHSVCLRFIQKYWYLVGLSPDSQQMDENDFNSYVDQSLFQQVSPQDMLDFEEWRKALDWKKKDGDSTKPYMAFWREWLRTMVNKVRYYHINDLVQSRKKSKEEIEAVFARYAFSQDEYNQCKEELEATLRNKTNKDGTLKNAARDRIEYLNSYDPKTCNGKVEIEVLKGVEDEFQAWELSASKVVFSDDRKTATINIVEKLFNILIEWREEYQHYKQTNKMLDFNDMEVYFSQLLEKDEVKAEIGNYKLVLVDEFQDCNPMQIDIFKRISDLVPRSIWVGDPKQAIYGFRGTDTALVKEVSDQIVDGENGCQRASLDTNYRSRKELVTYVNGVFLPIFRNSPFTLPDGEIELKAGRPYAIEFSPQPLHSWTVKKGRSVNFSALAHNIRELVNSKNTWVEPKGQAMRLAQYGDIAILVRKNGTISKVTNALREFGVPFFAMDDNDKQEQPIEQQLLMALAQYKLSPKYRPHLRADILHLLKSVPTQELLEDYFAHISVILDENNKRQYIKRDEWKTDDELIQRIDQIITGCYANGLYDTLATLVDQLRIYDLVAMWGDSEIRRSHISRTLRLAEGFDHHCEILEISKPTFAQYAEYMADAQAKTELDLNSPSVKVLTMHKSKGLEWPIVIYYDGDNDFAEDKKIVEHEFFSIREQRNKDHTYWLRVFPCVTNNSTAYQCLYNESYFRESKQRVVADETRLRYVAFTRARDILITIRADKDGSVYAPDSTLQTYTLIDTAQTQQEGSDLTYLVNPSKSGITSALKPSCTTTVNSITIHKKENVRMNTIGTCIHNIYAAYNASMDEQRSISMAQKIIESVKLSQILNAKEVIGTIRSLYDYLNKKHGAPTSIGHEVPFSFVRDNGQLLRGEIDLLWYTEDGVVLVDYKNIQGEEANPEHYTSQMEAYREVIESTGLKCKGIVLFYATIGQIIELK